MSAFTVLLDVQLHDTTVAQLVHRRSHLPEHARVVELEGSLAAKRQAQAPTEATDAVLAQRQATLEAQLAEVDAKIASADRSLYGGTVTATRELQALEADIASLKRRRSELEDLELEVLVEREPVDAALAASRAAIDELESQLAAARVTETEAGADIDAHLISERAARDEAAAAVDPALLARYDGIRTKNRGIGIAQLSGGTCGSCRLKIASVELDRIRSLGPDAVVTCDECGALLVR